MNVDSGLIAELKRREIGHIPTLTRDLSVFQYTSVPDYLTDPFFLRGESLFRPQIERVKDPTARQDASQPGRSRRAAMVGPALKSRHAVRRGVRIAMGTDSGTSLGRWQGYFEHVEMELMVKAGMTAMQMAAATGDAAKTMAIDAELGTLQPGKRADFVVLSADPLADIRNTRTIESVWIDGRRID